MAKDHHQWLQQMSLDGGKCSHQGAADNVPIIMSPSVKFSLGLCLTSTLDLTGLDLSFDNLPEWETLHPRCQCWGSSQSRGWWSAGWTCWSVYDQPCQRLCSRMTSWCFAQAWSCCGPDNTNSHLSSQTVFFDLKWEAIQHPSIFYLILKRWPKQIFGQTD